MLSREIKARHCVQKKKKKKALLLKSLSCFNTFHYLNLWSCLNSHNNDGIMNPFGQVAAGSKTDYLFLGGKKKKLVDTDTILMACLIHSLFFFSLIKIFCDCMGSTHSFIPSDKTQNKMAHLCFCQGSFSH